MKNKIKNIYIPLSQRPNLKRAVESYMTGKLQEPRIIKKMFSYLIKTKCIRECKPVMKADAQMYIDNGLIDSDGTLN